MDAAAGLVKALIDSGPIGILAAAALGWVGALLKWGADKDKTLAALNKARHEDMEERYQEVKVLVEKVVEAVKDGNKAVALVTAAFENTNRLNETRLTSLQTIAIQLEPIIRELRELSGRMDRNLGEIQSVKLSVEGVKQTVDISQRRDQTHDRGRDP